MVKCEYCGKEIGILAVRYTWIEKGKRAIHDKCLKKQDFEKKMKAERKERTKFYEELKKQSKEKPEKNN